MTECRFDRYYPHILNLIHFQIGTDGTRRSELINLVPKPQSASNPTPALDLGVFMRDTSVFTIQENKDGELQHEVNALHSDVFCKTVVVTSKESVDFDQTAELSTGEEVSTRIYLCLFFESVWPAAMDIFRFMVVSSILVSLTMFTRDMELDDFFAANSALILTDVALLLTLEKSDQLTTTERVLVLHVLSMLVVTIFEASAQTGDPIADDFDAVIFVSVMLCITVIYVLWEWSCYRRLVSNLKRGFYNDNRREALFQDIGRIM